MDEYKVISSILDKQLSFYQDKINEIQTKDNDEEKESQIRFFLSEYEKNLGKSIFSFRQVNEGELPYYEEHKYNIDRIKADSDILFEQVNNLGSIYSSSFNYANTEKEVILKEIEEAKMLIKDMSILNSKTKEEGIFYRDSFNNFDFIDESKTVGNKANISTRDGIVTLGRKGTTNRSSGAHISEISGNGNIGNERIGRGFYDDDGNFNIVKVSEQVNSSEPSSLLDSRPDTIFEYQRVNILKSEAINVAKGYDLEDLSGRVSGDTLRLRLLFELDEVKPLNWISLSPFFQERGNKEIKVRSLKTSIDGIEFNPIYGVENINTTINMNPETYRMDELFDGSNDFDTSKFAGKGIWSFSTRDAKFIEFVIDQDVSYPEKIWHSLYFIEDKNSEERTQIPSSKVPERVIVGKDGSFRLDRDNDIVKETTLLDGWRYSIGIRDIDIMSHNYETKSEFVSKKFASEEPIHQILLYSNEKIPREFLDKNETANDWIQYYISIDDVEWIRISPQHHSPVNDSFPPQIIEITRDGVSGLSDLIIRKTKLELKEDVTDFRLKVVLSRPEEDEYEGITPILEDYAVLVKTRTGGDLM